MRILNLLVEGQLDRAVGERIAEELGFTVGARWGIKGSSYIEEKISGFNKATREIPTLVLIDMMDTQLGCPPAVIESWVPHRSERLLFRVVVREVESWLLADRKNIAEFLKVAIQRVPQDPEGLDDPKQTLVNIARKSRSSKLKRLLVPEQGSTAAEGPAYTSEMQQFVRSGWNLEAASKNAPSLASCLRAVRSLAQAEEP